MKPDLPTDGVLETVLDMATACVPIGDQRLMLGTCRQRLPGPLFRSKPGDRLTWNLRNNMLIPGDNLRVI